MPDRLSFVAAVSGGGFDLPSGVVDLRVIGTGAQAAVRISDYATGEAHLLTPGGTGNFTASGMSEIDLSVRVAISLPGAAAPASLLRAAVDDAFDVWDAGGRSSSDVQLSTSSFYGDAGALLAVRVGNVDVVYVASAAGDGVAGYQVSSSGVLTRVDNERDTFDRYLDGVTTMAMAEVGGSRFLFAGSALEHGITSFSISGSGRLTETGHLGAAHQLPVQTITALDTVTVGGATYLIAAAAGSSSLSVMQVSNNGTLHTTDHVLDGRGTRFAGVTELASLEVDGMVFVAVAGSDHGLSLLTLTEHGTLVHLDTIADSVDVALAGVTGLAMVQTAWGLEIFTTAGAEAGISQFRVDLTPFQGSGSSGDDIIVDTGAADTLSGGDGSDVFFLSEDGQRDVISDVVVGEDQIDLSGWGFFYDIAQLDISSRSWGAIIEFRGERLDLHSANGQPLDAVDIATLVIPGMNRFAISEASEMEFPGMVLEGTAGHDDLHATNNSDNISGKAGNDMLVGRSGADTIYGGAGNDTLDGGGGNDLLQDASGQDVFIGGSGNDTVSYVDHFSGVTVNLKTGANTSGDSYSSIEHLFGSGSAADNLTGNDGGNILRGFDGDDTLSGGRGDDTLVGGGGDDFLSDASGRDDFLGGDGNDTVSYFDHVSGVVVNLETGENSSGDQYSGIENLRGSYVAADNLTGTTGDNRLSGYGGDDTLAGGQGDDTLMGGAGDDMFEDASGQDHFIGGSGNDTVSYFNHQSGVRVHLGNGSNNSGDTYSSIENLRGSNVAADDLTGHGGDNRLRGFGGDDTLAGARGDDTLEGGAGDDFLHDVSGRDHFIGGSGNDTVSYFDRKSGIIINLETGANNSGDTYSSIENLQGTNAGADSLTGHEGDNRLRGFGGDDTLAGGRGDDTLEGGAGNDFFEDASGRDSFIGGSGNDTVSYFDHQSGVRVNLANGDNSSGDSYSSIENLRGSNLADDELTGHAGNNRLRGFGGDDRLFGGSGDDTLEGGAGDDYLRDESGADVFLGGSGNDTVSYYGRKSGITVNLETGFNNSGDSYESIENVIGSNVGGDDLTGHAGDNNLRGFSGDDTLDGGRGDDTLNGGNGDDLLLDASGRDRFIGGAGNDTVSYSDHVSGVTVHLGTGVNSSGDTYSGIENIIGSATAADKLVGDTGNNALWGQGGNDTLIASDGDDRIYGGIGNDQLRGGAGDDYLRDENGADWFYGGTGNDTVSYYGHQSGVTANLETGSNSSGDRYFSIENLMGSNLAADALTGAQGHNHIWGFGGRDVLDGGGGNDTLNGGRGKDTITGGTGSDEFVFNRHDGQDIITDFQAGHDTISFGISGLTYNDLEIIDTSNGAVITYDPNDTITLSGVSASALGIDDFDFG